MKLSFVAGFLPLLSVASSHQTRARRLSSRLDVDANSGVAHHEIVISEGLVNPDGGKERYVTFYVASFVYWALNLRH